MKDILQIQLIEQEKTLIIVEDFNFSKSFMDPGAAWNISISTKEYGKAIKQFQRFEKVSLILNGAVILTGYMDGISTSESSSGTTIRVKGQSSLSLPARSSVDEDLSFASTAKLKDLLLQLFAEFNYTKIEVDDITEKQKITKSTKQFILDEHNEVIEKALLSPISSRTKPLKSEGVFEYATRIMRRFGAHVYDSADGKTLFIGSPDYKSPSLYTFTCMKNTQDNQNNIISCDIDVDWDNQPSVLIVEGRGGGGKKAKRRLKTLMYNELLCGSEEIPKALAKIAKYPSMHVLPRRPEIKAPANVLPNTKFAKILTQKDDESKTQLQLDNYARSVMSGFQAKFFVAKIKVAGASQNGINFAVNTMCDFKNEAWNINGRFWIKSIQVRGSKSGTTTDLELIIPHTITLNSKA